MNTPDQTHISPSVLRWSYILLLAGSVLWCGLILAAPLLERAGYAPAADVLYSSFHRICHQQHDRSFSINGAQWGVCIRCSAIYFSFLAGLLLYPLFRPLRSFAFPRRAWLFALCVPMVVDVGLSVMGIYHCSTFSRIATGSLFGAGVVFFIVPAYLEGVAQLLARHSLHSPSFSRSA